MKAKDLQTLGTLLAEYGMKPGVSTSVGDQKTGQQAKATAASTPSKSPTLAPSKSPTLNPATKADEPEQPEPVKAIAKDLKKGSAVVDADGEDLEIVDMVGNASNPDTVVAKNGKGEFVTVDPDSEMQVAESDDKFDRITKRKNKLKKKIKHLLRAQKHMQQGDPVFEINFNNKQVAQSALNADISCGFEAEVVFPNVEGNSEDEYWLEDKKWYEVEDLIMDQEGRRGIELIQDAYSTWLIESDQFYEIEQQVVRDMVEERLEDEYYINEYVEDMLDSEDIEEYKAEKLADLESAADDGDESAQAEFEEYSDWDDDAWSREYVELNKQDDFVQWIEEHIRDNGEAMDDAYSRAYEEITIDDWMDAEYGNWNALLVDYDIYLYPEGGGGVEEVARMLEDWAENNSKSSEVEAGEYHQGAGNTAQEHWRVEEDSSIEGSGAGAEIISPVYDTPAEMLKEMKSLFDWLEDERAETNRSTGLHVTMSLRGDVGKENPLKLALLLGDKYLLKQFGREFNSYAKSQQDRVIDQIKRMDLSSGDVSSEELDELESMLKRGIDYGKFSSINFKDMTNNDGNKLIEFRIGGGEDYHEKFDTVAKSAIRYAVTMQAAHDDQAYRKDYVRAIMRLVDSAQDGFSDSEREKLQKGAGLDLPQTRFVDYIKSISSKQHYLDNLQLLKSAYDSTMSGNDALYKLLHGVLTKQAETSAKVTSQIVAAMREMVKDFQFDADDFFGNYLSAKVLTDRSPLELTQYIELFNQLAKTKHQLPASAKVETITVPDGHVLFMKREDAFNLRDHEDWDTSMFKFVEREVWSVAARALQLLTDPTMGPDHLGWDTAIGLFGGGSGDEDIAKSQAKKYIDDFTRTYGFTPALSGNQDDSNSYSPINVISMNRALASHPTKKGKIVSESAFDKFGQLPLTEQLRILSKVDKRKLDEAWSKKYKKSIDCNNPKGFSQKAHCAGKKKNETIEAEQDMAALLTAYGTPKKKKKKSSKVKEGAVPVHNTQRDYAEIMNKPLLGSDVKAQMQAYFVVPDPSMIREFRAQIAMGGRNVDLRPTFKAFADRQLHPKDKKSISESILSEARGVTARQPGEEYISDTDPSDILTIQSIDVFPNDGTPAYDSVEDLQSVLDQAVPDDGKRIDDNNPTSGSKAAIVATVTDKNGDDQYWVRFIKAVPSTGVDNLWKTLRGYKYSKGASRESIPVKPSDMVTPNTFITTEKVAADVNDNATRVFGGTEHEALIEILNESVKKARANDTSPISGAAPYFNVLQKYAGEYLGPLALVDGGNLSGDTPQMLAAYDLQTLKGSQLMFPDDTSYELVDSIIKTPDGKEIGISSKTHTGGGAPSSLSGVIKQLTPEIEQRYPRGTAIMKVLGNSPIKLGPVFAAKELGILTDQDVEDFKQVPPGSRDLSDIKNSKLRNIAANQGVKDENHPNYRVLFRLLAGIVNQIIPKINADPEFISAMKETLNSNNFIQLLQKGKKVGDDVTMDYYTKYPAVFAGAPKLVNKGYAGTMAKDRLGFKLK